MLLLIDPQQLPGMHVVERDLGSSWELMWELGIPCLTFNVDFEIADYSHNLGG